MTFKNAISGLKGTAPLLPIAHVTTFEQFEAVAAAGSIASSSRCPRNGLQASYFFYGAPFYKVPNRRVYEQDYDDAAQNVIALLLPSTSVQGVSSEVYPFDTGALHRGLYEPILSRGEDLTRYLAESEDAALDAAKVVELLYGDNGSYIYGETAGSGPASTAPQDSVRAVSKLHRAKLPADIRRRVVEIVSLASVPWPNGRVVLIAPRRYLERRRKESVDLHIFLADPRIQVCTYNDMYPYNPVSDSRLVLDLAVEWLRTNLLVGEPP